MTGRIHAVARWLSRYKRCFSSCVRWLRSFPMTLFYNFRHYASQPLRLIHDLLEQIAVFMQICHRATPFRTYYEKFCLGTRRDTALNLGKIDCYDAYMPRFAETAPAL